MSVFTIGRLARAADVKVPTIRFYEEIGLMPKAERTESDRRIYNADAVRRLAFIKHARQLGFGVEDIRSLLGLTDHPERNCEEANRIARRQLADVEAKIDQLEALRSELQRMLDAECRGEAASCRVIESLADHTLCRQDHGVLQRTIS